MFRIEDQKPPIVFEKNWGEREENPISRVFKRTVFASTGLLKNGGSLNFEIYFSICKLQIHFA